MDWEEQVFRHYIKKLCVKVILKKNNKPVPAYNCCRNKYLIITVNNPLTAVIENESMPVDQSVQYKTWFGDAVFPRYEGWKHLYQILRYFWLTWKVFRFETAGLGSFLHPDPEGYE